MALTSSTSASQIHLDHARIVLHLVHVPSASTRAFVQHVTLRRARARSPCRAPPRPRCSPRATAAAPPSARLLRRHAGDRLVDQQQLPAPASAACRSPATASGRATGPARRRAASVRPMMSSTLVDALALLGVEPATQRLPERRWSPASASSRFSNTVSCSNTVGFWNLRPMPACAISGSVKLRADRSLPPNQAVPDRAASCR